MKFQDLTQLLEQDESIFQPRRLDDREQRLQRYVISQLQLIKQGKLKDLNLSELPVKTLPNGIKVPGSIILRQTKIESLPDDIKMGGSLDLYNTPIKTLPPSLLSIPDNLVLSASAIEKLPDGLEVGGDLRLSYTNIKSLPNGLKVGDMCVCLFSELEHIGENVEIGTLFKYEIGGYLNLSNCSRLKSLPKSLVVHGDINLSNTAIPWLRVTDLEKIRELLPGVKGNIYLGR